MTLLASYPSPSKFLFLSLQRSELLKRLTVALANLKRNSIYLYGYDCSFIIQILLDGTIFIH
jgi:hypothetical protein